MRVIRGVCVLAALAAATALVGCKGQEDPDDAAFGGQRGSGQAAPVAGDRRPALEFPNHVRSEDRAVNDFIRDFYGACARSEYDRFRLMVSSRADPFTPERFKAALEAVELVEILAVEKLPEVQDVPPPIYLVRARVRLRPDVRKDELEKTIAILVFREGAKLVMAPAPAALREGLDAFYEAEQADDRDEPDVATSNPARGSG